MNKRVPPEVVSGLLSFNAGFVDTASFLGLQGLFVSHVTGNFVTLGATLVLGSHGVYGKLLALPAFVLALALARLLGNALRARHMPVLRVMLAIELVLLATFFLLAVVFGPFADADSPMALAASLAGVAAMAVQNGLQRVHLGGLPPTTIMTGNTTQATLDAVDLVFGGRAARTLGTRLRLGRLLLCIATFAAGCAASALLYWLVGLWNLALAVAVGAVTTALHVETA